MSTEIESGQVVKRKATSPNQAYYFTFATHNTFRLFNEEAISAHKKNWVNERYQGFS